MKLLFAAAAFGFAVLVAEFGVRALMPAGRLLSPAAIETFHERARVEASMIQADLELGHVPVLDGEHYDRFGLLRGWGTRSGGVDKQPGVRRVLMLGDSVTRRATIAAPLRALWTGGEVEFLNAGVESWNPVQEITSYLRHQAQLDADHVVLWLHNNDLSESTVACLHDGQFTLCNPGAFVPVDPDWYGRSILYQLYVHSRHTDRLRPEHYAFRAADVERALAQLRDEVQGRGARLTVGLLPIFSAERDWAPHERQTRELELAMLDRLGVEWFDLQPTLEQVAALGLPVRATPNDVYHPNDEAGQLLARAAAEHLFDAPPVSVQVAPRVVALGGQAALEVAGAKVTAGRRGWVVTAAALPVSAGELAAATEGAAALAFDQRGAGSVALDAPATSGGWLTWRALAVAGDGGEAALVGWPAPLIVAPR